MSFTPQLCFNSECTFHNSSGGTFIKKGFFKIKRLNQKVRRYQCQHCKKYFSSRSFKPDYRHKKKDLNTPLANLLNEGVSLRAASRLLNMTYKNTYNKFIWLIKEAAFHKKKLQFNAHELQFDEMETIHHTKCKPLSIVIMVNEKYQILSLEVAQMPAKGRLAEISRRKYGYRSDERELVMKKSFQDLKNRLMQEPAKILSDAKPSYRKFVRAYFPDKLYETYNRAEKERYRSRIHEKFQKKRFDPLFALNQRCALLRSQIKRLTRRSWCTTKKVENLQGHLDLFLVSQFKT